ncbi:MFS transporter [Nonomuraea phyllanthi]|uniref:MFS transporter n=1 Tax=Nonomuraea phyllanthi TaxID=2219224 RepID=A0A5C4W620_9ACTN|nr:MFS transporter [Nonomuraea phyllanthi]KAB8191821.1 MFS transporter [Nonomuraea phyllanthi]
MWRRFGSFERSVRLLMVNQFAINIGFYMLMPYLAGHLSGGLHLAGWTVGLVLGVRNLSQQGLFLLGGTLADRLGYRPVIIAGCLLRTAGFALLGFVDAVPALVAASAMTGFAGALFNPAVRAYLAHDSGQRRVEAFALFNVFYQAGILIGPLLGLALMTVNFQLVCAAASAVFAVLTVLQLLALPPRGTRGEARAGVLADWRTVAGNRPFLLFSLAMAGSYVLSFQLYLALPLELGDTGAVSLLFVVSALVAIAGQLRITEWARGRWSGPQAVVRGLTLMAIAFVPLMAPAPDGLRTAEVMACTVLLAVGGALTYPFEMDTVVTLSKERLVATHYGLYNTVAGIGITAGNLLVGAMLGGSRVWIVLTVVGSLCALAVSMLNRAGVLAAEAVPAQAGP